MLCIYYADIELGLISWNGYFLLPRKIVDF